MSDAIRDAGGSLQTVCPRYLVPVSHSGIAFPQSEGSLTQGEFLEHPANPLFVRVIFGSADGNVSLWCDRFALCRRREFIVQPLWGSIGYTWPRRMVPKTARLARPTRHCAHEMAPRS